MNEYCSTNELLVTTDWLSNNLDNPNIRIVDCTMHLRPNADFSSYEALSGQTDFNSKHIPGSVFIDSEKELSQKHPKLRFALPPPDSFAKILGKYGISNSSRIIAYSSGNPHWATRFWWLLKIFGHRDAAVLDGGLQKWIFEKKPVSSRPNCTIKSCVYQSSPLNSNCVATMDEVQDNLDNDDICLVNALSKEQHNGTSGVHYGRKGHIKNSINIPSSSLFNPSNTIKSQAELKKILNPVLDKNSVITYCGSGIAASSIVFSLELIGYKKVKMYDNSLTEWASHSSLPMEF